MRVPNDIVIVEKVEKSGNRYFNANSFPLNTVLVKGTPTYRMKSSENGVVWGQFRKIGGKVRILNDMYREIWNIIQLDIFLTLTYLSIWPKNSNLLTTLNQSFLIDLKKYLYEWLIMYVHGLLWKGCPNLNNFDCILFSRILRWSHIIFVQIHWVVF